MLLHNGETFEVIACDDNCIERSTSTYARSASSFQKSHKIRYSPDTSSTLNCDGENLSISFSHIVLSRSGRPDGGVTALTTLDDANGLRAREGEGEARDLVAVVLDTEGARLRTRVENIVGATERIIASSISAVNHHWSADGGCRAAPYTEITSLSQSGRRPEGRDWVLQLFSPTTPTTTTTPS